MNGAHSTTSRGSLWRRSLAEKASIPSSTAGRTRQNKLLHFVADRPLRPGTFVNVRVVGAAPHHLKGEMLDVTSLPTHKTRIPVSAR